MEKYATKGIRVRVSTKKKLDELGKKGDTYDGIIRRLIEKSGEEM